MFLVFVGMLCKCMLDLGKESHLDFLVCSLALNIWESGNFTALFFPSKTGVEQMTSTWPAHHHGEFKYREETKVGNNG